MSCRRDIRQAERWRIYARGFERQCGVELASVWEPLEPARQGRNEHAMEASQSVPRACPEAGTRTLVNASIIEETAAIGRCGRWLAVDRGNAGRGIKENTSRRSSTGSGLTVSFLLRRKSKWWCEIATGAHLNEGDWGGSQRTPKKVISPGAAMFGCGAASRSATGNARVLNAELAELMF